jgi:hypothetical protein
MIACGYRPEELPEDAAADIAALAAAAEHMPLRALRVEEVTALVTSLSGAAAARRWGRQVYSRSGGHPFFARELCHLIASGDPAADVPDAVREVVVRRVHRLSSDCRGLLDIAAVAGPAIRPGCSPTSSARTSMRSGQRCRKPPRPACWSPVAARRPCGSRTTCSGRRSSTRFRRCADEPCTPASGKPSYGGTAPAGPRSPVSWPGTSRPRRR